MREVLRKGRLLRDWKFVLASLRAAVEKSASRAYIEGMRRDEVIARLKQTEPALKAFGVAALYLFGSHARDEAGPNSDIDVFVDPAADLRPMLATLGVLPKPPTGWAYEVKWDGIRALASVSGGRIRLEARSGRDVTHRYPELRELGPHLRLDVPQLYELDRFRTHLRLLMPRPFCVPVA